LHYQVDCITRWIALPGGLHYQVDCITRWIALPGGLHYQVDCIMWCGTAIQPRGCSERMNAMPVSRLPLWIIILQIAPSFILKRNLALSILPTDSSRLFSLRYASRLRKSFQLLYHAVVSTQPLLAPQKVYRNDRALYHIHTIA